MNVTKKLICVLAAGATLGIAAPVFADSGRGRDFDHDRDYRHYGYYDAHAYRWRHRDYDHRRFVVVQPPVVIERPVYYAPPAPVYYAPPAPVVYGVGPATVIGAVIGGIIDSQR